MAREIRERKAASIPAKSLAGELVELRKDKARLDWIEAHHKALNATFGPWYHWSVIRSHNVTRLMLRDTNVFDIHDSDPRGGPDIRSAIDTAMESAR